MSEREMFCDLLSIPNYLDLKYRIIFNSKECLYKTKQCSIATINDTEKIFESINKLSDKQFYNIICCITVGDFGK